MKALKLLTLALFTAGSLVMLSGSGTVDDKQAVTQAVEKLRKAMIDPEKATLEALVANDLSYGHSSGTIEDKAAFVEALVSGASDFKSIELTDQTVTVVDNTAMVRHKLTGETNNKGVAGQVKLGVLLVWVKQKGDWKLLARQAFKM
ncbi:nuclear transport factor 2 family protein [Fibrisoma montanum]|uniref:Nuclear transport factor 2 family protein n=1 Tax=Fibrisoma montanum TaxID=2305895 RepID=A0A418MBH4_9BACT|nr:nuclear transport factor 2 family protein [Fibrisoma montanum]RIV23717.1 nuclear transport factor 2 family protein [Fibrisoma montanum]